MEGDVTEPQPDGGKSLINEKLNAIIEEATSSSSNHQSTLDQIISQITTENEGSSRCTSPEGSLLSRRSSVIGTGSEIDLILPPLPEVNKGGSARTDFCSNAILSARARKRRLFRQHLETGSSHDEIGNKN